MDELKTALASLYKKKGKTSLTEKEFVFAASMDFRWYTPKEAQKLLDLALDSQLAEADGDKIILTFNHKETNIPKGYKPGPGLLEIQPKPKGLFLEIVDFIAKESGKSGQDIIARANRKKEKMKIYSPVAAMLVAEELDVDASQYVEKVEEDMKGKLDS